jgi:hypothetical protein
MNLVAKGAVEPIEAVSASPGARTAPLPREKGVAVAGFWRTAALPGAAGRTTLAVRRAPGPIAGVVLNAVFLPAACQVSQRGGRLRVVPRPGQRPPRRRDLPLEPRFAGGAAGGPGDPARGPGPGRLSRALPAAFPARPVPALAGEDQQFPDSTRKPAVSRTLRGGPAYAGIGRPGGGAAAAARG